MVNFATGPGKPVSFETQRLIVGRYAPTDEADLYAAATESVNEVYPWLPWCHPGYQLQEARDWISIATGQWEAGDAYNFVIRDRTSRRLLGGCGLNQLDEHRSANLGYWIRSAAMGQGIATEATLGLARYGFDHLDLQRVEIVMATANGGSRQVAIKAGATFEGEMRDRLYLHGKVHNAYLYALLPGDVPG